VKQVHTKREKGNTKVCRFTKQANELSACLPACLRQIHRAAAAASLLLAGENLHKTQMCALPLYHAARAISGGSLLTALPTPPFS